MSAGPVVLRTLVPPMPDVELPSGVVVPVRALDGHAAQMAAALAAAPSVAGTYDLACYLLPAASREDVLALTPDEVAVVVQLAQGGLAAAHAVLESRAGNGPGGAAASPAPPTPSPTSA